MFVILIGAAGNDYGLVSETLLFTPGGSSVLCFNVSIIDDDILETTEYFMLSLNLLDQVVDSARANVSIIDNECKNTSSCHGITWTIV